MWLPDQLQVERFLCRHSGAENVRVDLAPGSTAGRCDLDVEFSGGQWSGRVPLTLISGAAEDHDLARDFAARKAAFEAGVATGEPMWLDDNGTALGLPGFVIRRVSGHLDLETRRYDLGAEVGDAIVRRVGEELAKLHSLSPATFPGALAHWPVPGVDWARLRAGTMRERLDGAGAIEPVFEWAINWFEDHAPAITSPVLVHGDLRAARLCIEGEALTGIDGFGASGWSDAMADLGQFCARFWRGGAPEREAGGIGSRAAFYAGYRSDGREVDEERVSFWEVFAPLWAGVDAIAGGGRQSDPAGDWSPAEWLKLRAIEAEYDLLMDITKLKERAS